MSGRDETLRRTFQKKCYVSVSECDGTKKEINFVSVPKEYAFHMNFSVFLF